jgi:predicted dinucleotide-binding enzyme
VQHHSLGEQIQRAFPDVKVVKTLNTVNCHVMVNPALIPGEHSVFVCGNDAGAKTKVKEILADWFGWRSIVDLGDISGARGAEMYLPLWLRLFGAMQTPNVNVKVLRG